MYDLSLTMLLMLPSFSLAAPTQPINSLALIAPGPSTVNAIGPEPIDPRFSMQPVYQATRLDEDDCLVAAVQLVGGWGSNPFTQPVQTPISYWDDYVPRVKITIQSPRTRGSIETRFLVWGLYLGVKDMIVMDRFRNVQLVLKWDGQNIGFISIEKRVGPLPSLPGTGSANFTSTVRQRSDSVNLYISGSQNGTSFNIPLQNAPSSNANDEMAMKIEALPDKPIPKHTAIMALLEGILTVASRTSRAPVPMIVQVQPPAPYGAKLIILPERMVSGRPYLTFGMIAIAIRQIPATLLLGAHAWLEVRFRIEVDDVLVARGGLSMP